MAVNHKSGRLVVDINPELKLALHAALAADGLSLKDWVVKQAREYVDARTEPRLYAVEPPVPTYRDK
jgi:predicted HicB family RNase H-like nuclease